MSTTIEGSGIDKVLTDAVAAGAVPHVAAIAADADSLYREVERHRPDVAL